MFIFYYRPLVHSSGFFMVIGLRRELHTSIIRYKIFTLGLINLSYFKIFLFAISFIKSQ